MKLENILKALNEINKFARPKFIQNSNFCSSDKIVSWHGYESGIYKGVYYAKEYENLLNNKQYSFLLKDNSFLQYYYELGQNGLRKAKLCYYPVPIESKENRDMFIEYIENTGIDIIAELYLQQYDLIESGNFVVNTSHFRIDYDQEATTHSISHLQFGAINNFRIEADHVLNPFLFFDWVIKLALSATVITEFAKVTNTRDYRAAREYHSNLVTACDIKEQCPFLSFLA